MEITLKEEVNGSSKAEMIAKSFLENRYKDLKRVLVTEISRESGVWIVLGEIFRKRLFFTFKRWFVLKIDSKTGVIISYRERKKQILES